MAEEETVVMKKPSAKAKALYCPVRYIYLFMFVVYGHCVGKSFGLFACVVVAFVLLGVDFVGFLGLGGCFGSSGFGHLRLVGLTGLLLKEVRSIHGLAFGRGSGHGLTRDSNFRLC